MEPDWNRPCCTTPDIFQALRRQWATILLNNSLVTNMNLFFNSGDDQLPFTDEDLSPFKPSLSEFIQSHGLVPDWSIREDQPMQLSIMAAVSSFLDDRDKTLFPILLAGAPPGFDSISDSGCFSPVADNSDETVPLSIPSTHWQSAASDLPTSRTLVSQELKKVGYFNILALWKRLNKNLVISWRLTNWV